MTALRLFAVTDKGLVPLDIPEGATDFGELYDTFSLGTYSALRTFEHNQFLQLDWHIARTRQSMQLLGIDYMWNERRFRRALHEAVTAYPAQNARVRFDILSEPARLRDPGTQELIALKPFRPVPSSYYVEGVGAEFASGLRRTMAQAKAASFVAERSQYAPGHTQSHYEYLILDQEGRILEGTMTNFWAVKNGEVWTAEEGVLEGVTRRIILSLLPELGIPLRLAAVHKCEIADLTEAAISGSSRAVVPVVQIDGKKVGEGQPGPIFKRVLSAYQAYVARTIRTAIADLD
jgi:branched-subunit amino acid aminotransferase/4-amino-4-deoxychorismate lyase